VFYRTYKQDRIKVRANRKIAKGINRWGIPKQKSLVRSARISISQFLKR